MKYKEFQKDTSTEMQKLCFLMAAFINEPTEYIERVLLMVVHSEYSALIKEVVNWEMIGSSKTVNFTSTMNKVVVKKTSVVKIGQNRCDCGLLFVRFHLPHLLTEDIGSFLSMKLTEPLPFER